MTPALETLIAHIRQLGDMREVTSQQLRTLILRALSAAQPDSRTRWTFRRNVEIHTRGTKDGYHGRISLVAYPPKPQLGAFEVRALPPPILIEFGNLKVKTKSLHKLNAYDLGAIDSRLVILRRQAQSSPFCQIETYPQSVSNLWIIGLGDHHQHPKPFTPRQTPHNRATDLDQRPTPNPQPTPFEW